MAEPRTGTEPSDALMKMKEWEDAVYYRVACDCGSDDHDMSIWAETNGVHDCYEIRFGTMMVANTYRTRFYSKWLQWLNVPVDRVAIALRVLFTGRVEMHHEFVLGKENVQGLRVALQDIERKFD
jgi:hypothetical protein